MTFAPAVPFSLTHYDHPSPELHPFEFFIGLHQPSDAYHFDRAFISINRIRERKSSFHCKRWIMDSAAFTEISTHGAYRHTVAQYATAAKRWENDPGLIAIVSQDYMCEPFILAKTGLTIEQHQTLTIQRYDELMHHQLRPYILPVLQGFYPRDYVVHIRQYGWRLPENAWVGVGSVCKRNSTPLTVLWVLQAIKAERPDLRLHGFGLKLTALALPEIRALLATADSMAWSLRGRQIGRGNDWAFAKDWERRILGFAIRDTSPSQPPREPLTSLTR